MKLNKGSLLVEALVAMGVLAIIVGAVVFPYSSSRDTETSASEHTVAMALANKYMSEIAVQSLATKSNWTPPVSWSNFSGSSDAAPQLPSVFPANFSINGVDYQTTIQWRQLPSYSGSTTATGYYSAEFIVKVEWAHASATGATRKGAVSVTNAFRCKY